MPAFGGRRFIEDSLNVEILLGIFFPQNTSQRPSFNKRPLKNLFSLRCHFRNSSILLYMFFQLPKENSFKSLFHRWPHKNIERPLKTLKSSFYRIPLLLINGIIFMEDLWNVLLEKNLKSCFSSEDFLIFVFA